MWHIFYRLDDAHNPVPCTMQEAAISMVDKKNSIVAQTHIAETFISTVFLHVNHQFVNGPPILFETMVFEWPLDGMRRRYRTWWEAIAGHDQIVAEVRDQYTTKETHDAPPAAP